MDVVLRPHEVALTVDPTSPAHVVAMEYHGAFVLRTVGITKRFGGIVAANELAIELRKGTITALVGPNGAGKTTVFNLLTGAIVPDAGGAIGGDTAAGFMGTPEASQRALLYSDDVRDWLGGD